METEVSKRASAFSIEVNAVSELPAKTAIKRASSTSASSYH
jgi:hypothetical protein